jgi:hypothetical protein
MYGLLKMSALSALLSFPAVSAYNEALSAPQEAPSAKLYQDRVPSQDGSLSPTRAGMSADTTSSLSPIRTGTASHSTPARTGTQKGDRLSRGECADQVWPYIASACLTGASERGKAVRMITVEAREGSNTSVLVRMPQTGVAAR